MGEIAVSLKELHVSRALQNDTKEFAALLNTDEFEVVEEQLKDENYRKNLVIWPPLCVFNEL